MTKLIYPSVSRWVVNHDDKGRVQSLTDDFENPYLSGMTKNLAGQVTELTLGTGVVENYGYHSNRLQLTTQTATKSGNQLMNLSYSYQATAGQMGAGSTAGNAAQLMGITGTMNSTTESAGYTYDLLGRLVTSSQTSNGASADRQFVYDRWGNRTEVYDGLPGGKNPPTLIQSITLQQSGGAPTNRITSVTSGSTVNYTYDAAGNVTNDGAHTYKYDAGNRIAKVDDGATAEYKYDHQNRRVTKVVGSSWTHYVWEGAHVIGEHDATTPLPGYGEPPYQEQSARLDYVHAGAKMIRSRQRATSTGPWTTAYFLNDRLSVRMTLNSSGNVLGRQGHLPFGEDFAESGTQQKHHVTSYERDVESGTDYAVNRQLAQSIGRFNRVDPLAPSARLAAPQSWNRYSYVHNEPVDQTDRLGLDSEPAPVPGHDHNDHGPCPAWMQYCPDGGSGFGLLLSGLPAAIGGGNGDGGIGSGFEFSPPPRASQRCEIGAEVWGPLTAGVPLTFPDGGTNRGPADVSRTSTVPPRTVAAWAWNVEIWARVLTGHLSGWTVHQEAWTRVRGLAWVDGRWKNMGPNDDFFRPDVPGQERPPDSNTTPRQGNRSGHTWLFWVDAPGIIKGNERFQPWDATITIDVRSWIQKGASRCDVTWHVQLVFRNGELQSRNAWADQ